MISVPPITELRDGLPYAIAPGLDSPVALVVILDLRLKKAVPAIFLGVCIAAAIMTAVTFGVIHIL